VENFSINNEELGIKGLLKVGLVLSLAMEQRASQQTTLEKTKASHIKMRVLRYLSLLLWQVFTFHS